MRDFAYVLSLASAFIPPSLAAETQGCGVIELRQYTLHAGQRDGLIELFEREFVESQEAYPMRLIGLFRDLDRPERFVWLRGFADMSARAQALSGFYGSPVWKAHRDAANATMIDSDNVLLLRPLHAETGFPDAPLPPGNAAQRARGVVEARLLYAGSELAPAQIQAAVAALDARLHEAGGTRLAVLVSEDAANNFPRLPVREGEQVLAWFAALPDEAARARFREALAGSPAWIRAEATFTAGAPRAPEALRLVPTARSRLPAAANRALKRTIRAGDRTPLDVLRHGVRRHPAAGTGHGVRAGELAGRRPPRRVHGDGGHRRRRRRVMSRWVRSASSRCSSSCPRHSTPCCWPGPSISPGSDSRC